MNFDLGKKVDDSVGQSEELDDSKTCSKTNKNREKKNQLQKKSRMMTEDLELDSSKVERNNKTERGDETSDEGKYDEGETDRNDFAENETNENKNDEDNKDKRDEEDEMERFEYEVEGAVAQFVDKKSIPRNTIPDSSDEEDEEKLVLQNRRLCRGKDEKLTLGRAFYTSVEFKEAVLDFVLRTGNNIVQDRWEKTKIGFKCGMKGKCQWRIYCSYDEPKKTFLVKTIYPNHSCTSNGKCKILKSPIIGRLFMDKLRRNEDFMPLDIQEHIKEQWRFVSSRNQCQRERGLAWKLLEKEYDEQFAHLRSYAQELITSNKDSTVIVEPVALKVKICLPVFMCVLTSSEELEEEVLDESLGLMAPS